MPSLSSSETFLKSGQRAAHKHVQERHQLGWTTCTGTQRGRGESAPLVCSASFFRPSMFSFWLSMTSRPWLSSFFWSSDRLMSGAVVRHAGSGLQLGSMGMQ